MRAIALDYEHRRVVPLAVAEPALERPDGVLFRIHQVGVCGTDRELATFHLGNPPAGESTLVLGHETLGQVVAAGPQAAGFRPGDWVVPMIRRACSPACPSCARHRRDLCLSGLYRERGIWGLHGYWCDFAVDAAEDLVPVPDDLVDVAVLIEPLSSVEKALHRAFAVHEGQPSSALVLGAGPIGLLAALSLQLRGLDVTVRSLEPSGHPRACWVRDAGMRYATGDTGDRADLVVEATGAPSAAEQGIRALAPLGVYVILGIADAPASLPLRDLIFGNQAVFGSVNASPASFRSAAHHLARFPRPLVSRLLHRVAFGDYAQSLLAPPATAPKTVHMAE